MERKDRKSGSRWGLGLASLVALSGCGVAGDDADESGGVSSSTGDVTAPSTSVNTEEPEAGDSTGAPLDDADNSTGDPLATGGTETSDDGPTGGGLGADACTDPAELTGNGEFVAQRELCLLRSVPQDLIVSIAGSTPQDPGCICDYKYAADLLVAALAAQNEEQVENAFSSLEEAASRQTPGGNFGGQSASAVSFFVAWTSHALLLLQASEQADEYADRIDAIVPALDSALDFLTSDSGSNQLWGAERAWPNRCFIAANAYGHSAVLLDRPDAEPFAQRYIDRVFSEGSDGLLDIWRAEDGVFLEGGTAACGPGSDSGYQGVGVWMFLRYLLYYPEPHPMASVAAVDSGYWLSQMIKPDGFISTEGNARTGPNSPEGKGVNTREVRKGLVYYGLLIDADGVDAAARTRQQDDGSYAPPDIAAIDDTSVESGATVSIPLTLMDGESPDVSLKVEVSSSNPDVLDPSAAEIDGRYSERTLEAIAGTPGTTEITVSVEDLGYRCESGRTNATSFTLTVTP